MEEGSPAEGELTVPIIYTIHRPEEIEFPPLFGEEGELVRLDELRDGDPDETDRHLESEGLQNLYSALIDGEAIVHVPLKGSVAGEGLKIGIAEGEGDGPSLKPSLPEAAPHLLR